jgi:alkylated DNA repair dioxygenase AlkB
MEQLTFFAEAGQSKGLPTELLDYKPGLFNVTESDAFLNKFIATAPWKQHTQKLYDKEVITPRLVAWYGDMQNTALLQKLPDLQPWTNELLLIKQKVEAIAGMQFNSVLLNYYRDGKDSVAWHSDKSLAPGFKTVVASVSFGQVRSFDIRNKREHSDHYSVRLEHGSYLLMKAGLQDGWEHRIAKSTKPMRARVNLTFRVMG